MKNIPILLTGIFLLNMVLVTCGPMESDEMFQKAMKSFKRRKRNYVKDNGISHNLEQFINKYSANIAKNRRKRQNLDKNRMYIIRDGEVVPFTDANLAEVNIVANTDKTDSCLNTTTSSSTSGEKCEGSKSIVTVKLEDDFTVLPLVVPLDNGAPYHGKSGATDDDKMIERIMEDVEGLSKLRHGSSPAALEGQTCNVSGSWISTAGGMELIIPDELQNKSIIELRKTVSPVNTNGFLMEGGWTLSLEMPFPHSSMVLIIGVRREGKKVATFIGECRFCSGIEALTGVWLLGRSSIDCKDQKASQELLTDIMRKNNVGKLQTCHLSELHQIPTGN